MKVTTDGVIQFYISARVSMDEMRDWSAERIAAFFDGIAKMEEARAGAVSTNDDKPEKQREGSDG